MRWLYAIVSKIKFLIITIVDLTRYVCCIKRNRRRPSTDYVPLSSVGVVSNDSFLQISSDDDVRSPIPNGTGSQPRNVQDYIKEYRQQRYKEMTSQPVQDSPTDYFQDMVPKIIQQQKVLVKQQEKHVGPSSVGSRLAFAPVTASVISKGNELADWEEMENTGSWDVDENTHQMLREDRQLERERRMMENSKKRTDKERSRIGSKVS